MEEFSVADFLLVYMDETHLSEDWSVSGDSSLSFEMKKHQKTNVQQTTSFWSISSCHPQCQVVAEHMDSNPNAVYDVAFECVCIVQRQRIAYLGGNGSLLQPSRNPALAGEEFQQKMESRLVG